MISNNIKKFLRRRLNLFISGDESEAKLDINIQQVDMKKELKRLKDKNEQLKGALEKSREAFVRAKHQLENVQKKQKERASKLQEALDRSRSAHKKVKEQFEAAKERHQKREQFLKEKADKAVSWVKRDNIQQTTDWVPQEVTGFPYILGHRSKPKILLLNSMGGSMSRLSRALMLYHQIDTDCFISAYAPRRHMLYPHETNVQGVFTHDEWRQFMEHAVKQYDIIQSTTLPMHSGIGECYDWLTDTIGNRHIWRSTGFVHHYLHREDILPLEVYQRDLGNQRVPFPERFACRTFENDGKHFLTKEHYLFYSSPEKGAYFEGKNTHWLPSIRDIDLFMPKEKAKKCDNAKIVIYVPHHVGALWKGLDHALEILEELKLEGLNLDIVTSDTASKRFPELSGYKAEREGENVAYPIPNHKMPDLFSKVDIVLDQIVMGSYGNSGIEAMLCGVPVIGQKDYQDLHEAPIYIVDKDNLKSQLMKIFNDREHWPEIGKECRKYAIAKHSPEAVSKIAANVYYEILDGKRF